MKIGKKSINTVGCVKALYFACLLIDNNSADRTLPNLLAPQNGLCKCYSTLEYDSILLQFALWVEDFYR